MNSRPSCGPTGCSRESTSSRRSPNASTRAPLRPWASLRLAFAGGTTALVLFAMLAAGGLHQAGSAVESVVGTFQNASSSAKGPNCQGGQLCVTVLGDTIVEPNETGLLNLTSVSDNAYIGDGQGVRTIVNDDK